MIYQFMLCQPHEHIDILRIYWGYDQNNENLNYWNGQFFKVKLIIVRSVGFYFVSGQPSELSADWE